MKLSIVFITYNRKHELIRAIHSCLKNKIDDMEIIVYDNHSEDGTQEEVEELFKKNNVDYRYIYSATNTGVAFARAKGFELAKGEYVFFLDDDAYIETPNFFEELCHILDKDEKVGAIVPEIYQPYDNRYLSSENCKICKHKDEELVLNYIGGAHIIRKSVFDNNQLYPLYLKFGSEEFYAGLHIYKSGYKILFERDLVVIHEPSNINRYDGKKRDINIILNYYVVKKLCYPICFRLIENVVFLLRLFKHNYLNKEDLTFLRTEFKKRYHKEEKNVISYSVLFKLSKLFGVKYII